MKINLAAKRDEIWNSGKYKLETKDLSYLDTSCFYKKKAIEECGLLKKGVFVNLTSHFGDVWIEVDEVWEDSNFMCLVQSYGRHRMIHQSNVRSIATEIKKLSYPNNPRIVYTKKGKYGTKKDGMPISDFLNDSDYK